MRFAKFSRPFAGLAVFGLMVFASNFSSAQEEMIPSQPAPPTDGMFDDELEPLDEIEPQVPGTPLAPPHGSMGGQVQIPPPPDEIRNMDRDRDLERDRERERDRDREINTPPSRGSNSSSSNKFPAARNIPPGTGRSLPPLPGGGKLPNENEKLRMDFVQVEIEEVVKYFAERLQRRFIYDPTMLSGKITIVSPTEVTLREAWAAFLSALEVRGYIVFPAGAFLKLEKAANARKAAVPVVTGETPNDDSFVTRIINLHYLSVNDIRQAVRNLLSRTAGDVIEHAPTNTLIISDYAFNIKRIVRILNILDVEGFQEQIAVIALKNASAADVARKVSEFFPSGSQSGGLGRIRARGGEGIQANPGISAGNNLASGQQSVIQKVVPDERTNSLIVLGSERGIDQVKKFIDQIDVPVEGGGGQIHVYHLQNVKAEDLSQTLSALASGQSSRRSSGSNNSLPTNFPGTQNLPSQLPGASGATTASLLNGDVKITADVPTNALVIQASPRDFDVLKGIIQKLDIRRRQVFIESAILEAKVGRASEFGTQAAGPFTRTGVLKQEANAADGTKKIDSAGIFSLGNLAQSLDSLLQRPDQLTGLALGFRSGGTFDIAVDDGKGGTITKKVPLLSAVLKLAASSENLNVLSTPHVLATANEEATISIGEEIPQITNSTRTDGGALTNSYTRLRVATELNITPQINADDYLTLKIKQKVNSVGTQSTDGQYNTINREAATTAIVKDQQTIVIGGLMEDRKTVTESKIPFLGDIPVLGWLFKSRSTNNNKVNFLLFLTPHIIRDTADMNDQFFRKLQEREKFLKDLGMKEQDGLPISGLTDEQLKMLDKEYVKSIRMQKLTPLPLVVPQSTPTPTHNPSIEPEAVMPPPPAPQAEPSLPMPEPTPAPIPELAPKKDLPLEDSPPDEMEVPKLSPIKSSIELKKKAG